MLHPSVTTIAIGAAEYNSMVTGTVRALGLQSMMKDMGVQLKAIVASARSLAAKSYA